MESYRKSVIFQWYSCITVFHLSAKATEINLILLSYQAICRNPIVYESKAFKWHQQKIYPHEVGNKSAHGVLLTSVTKNI